MVKETITTELQKCDWLFYETKPDGDYEPVNDQASIEAAAEVWKVSPELVCAVQSALEQMAEATHRELVDLYEKIQSLGD